MFSSHTPKNIMIVKGNGEREPFDLLKLEHSLLRAGASALATEKVLKKMSEEVRQDMTTSEIYEHAFFLLKLYEKHSAARYSIRKAVQDLGPTGFIFEKLLAEVYRAKGYTVETGKMVSGHCTEHEIDMIAYNDRKLIMGELKFHNQQGMKSDLKVALYVKARFDDLRKATFNFGGKEYMLSEGLLITNTKFTKTAIGYAMCAGVNLIGWNYPSRGNLHHLIEHYQLDPITSLLSLTIEEKRYLLEKGIITCKQILKDTHILYSAGFTQTHIRSILEEISSLKITT